MYPKYSERKICNLILHLYNLRNSEIKNIEKKIRSAGVCFKEV